ncbi:MAG: amidohydrolase family protein, partial [Armatimonadota bacterium]|nr:amidohydrolase family protein [Armatimonadota bacterium]
ALVALGARIGLGTDSPGTCVRFDFFEEMRLALALQRASGREAGILSAREVIELATIGGARALGLADRVGTLEPGKRADFVVLDVSEMLPTEDIWLSVLSGGPENVRAVVVDGVLIVENGELQGLDRSEILSELKERLRVE